LSSVAFWTPTTALYWAFQLEFVGDVAEEQQEAAERVGLPDYPQGASTGNAPQLVGRRIQGFVEAELVRLPGGVVAGLGKAATLAQAVEDLGVAGALAKPGVLQAPQFGEGGVVEAEAPSLAEDRHGVSQVVQGLVVGGDVALESLPQVLGLGDVDRQRARAPAVERLGDNMEGATLAPHRRPAERLPTLAERGRLGRQLVDASIKREVAADRVLEVSRVSRLKPGPVGPEQRAGRRAVPLGALAGGSDDPGGSWLGVEESGETGGARKARAGRRRQPEPGVSAGRATLD
jgi:hypothetical protein